MTTYFQWLKSEYGFSESKVKPYNFNPQPFIVNKQSATEGYATSEPFAVEKVAGFKPNVTPAGGLRVEYLLHLDREPSRADRQEAGPRAALRRRLHHRLVQLSLRQQCRRQRDDQEAQSGNDRRVAFLFDCQDEGIRHRRFRRMPEERYRRHERRNDRRASSTRWRGRVSARPTSITAKGTRCASPTRASGSICGRRRPSPLCPRWTCAGRGLPRGVTKIYDNGVTALGPFDLDVRQASSSPGRAVGLREIPPRFA